MNGASTKTMLKRLFGGQSQAARALSFNPRTVRYWCAFGAPPHVASVLRALRAEVITIEEARRRIRDERTKDYRVAQSGRVSLT